MADACEPATFGLNQEDVYDETYRKAGKLDSSNFALKFDPADLGLVDLIRTEMLEEGRTLSDTKPELAHRVRAELYKLNVRPFPQVAQMGAGKPLIPLRFTLGRPASSSLMSIRLAPRNNSVHWLSVCPWSTKVW